MAENGGGVVTREESCAPRPRFPIARSRTWTEISACVRRQAFADADLNGDGKISGMDFVQARFTRFEAIDASGDHEITFEEFRQLIQQYWLQPRTARERSRLG